MRFYFTSDQHFNHKNIIKYCNRPFSSVNEMNNSLIENWNLTINNDDVIYILGDFCFGDPNSFLTTLNGNKHFILGSHDNHQMYFDCLKNNLIKSLKEIETIKISLINKNIEITMSHYSMRNWPKSHYGTYHLYGHSHGKLKPLGLSYDVGVDNNNFYPVSLDFLLKYFEYKEKEIILL